MSAVPLAELSDMPTLPGTAAGAPLPADYTRPGLPGERPAAETAEAEHALTPDQEIVAEFDETAPDAPAEAPEVAEPDAAPTRRAPTVAGSGTSRTRAPRRSSASVAVVAVAEPSRRSRARERRPRRDGRAGGSRWMKTTSKLDSDSMTKKSSAICSKKRTTTNKRDRESGTRREGWRR
jgi:hypothetical protein